MKKTNTFEKENENNIYGFESIEIIKKMGWETESNTKKQPTGSEIQVK